MTIGLRRKGKGKTLPGENCPPPQFSVECLLSAVPREGWGGKAGTTIGEGRGREKGYSMELKIAMGFL